MRNSIRSLVVLSRGVFSDRSLAARRNAINFGRALRSDVPTRKSEIGVPWRIKFQHDIPDSQSGYPDYRVDPRADLRLSVSPRRAGSGARVAGAGQAVASQCPRHADASGSQRTGRLLYSFAVSDLPPRRPGTYDGSVMEH